MSKRRITSSRDFLRTSLRTNTCSNSYRESRYSRQPLVKAPTAVLADLLELADRMARVAKKLGLETVIWAALSASSLGLLVATRTSSEWMRGLIRPGATTATVR